MRGKLNYYLVKWRLFGFGEKWKNINLCGGGVRVETFADVDIYPDADIHVDLEKKLLPFASNSIDNIICISAINYFSRERGEIIVKDVYRVLKSGGIARFATQDLFEISKKYVNMDKDFFFQKLAGNRERFYGITMADKINSWFYGYKTTGNKVCKYFYDFETLALLFKEAGFTTVEKKGYLQSRLPHIDTIDNRPDQMFFLEAIK
ncbi:MAG: hypothetical protein A3E02_00765 [Candidatus Zambryskibacteria bacterium RIFCSPHIGHO2_12_FULL_38_34]|uniref:Methyltransferase type 11 domain-containing protein n=1 Tax=Candidatus Zambryskibacteria bacterium RIFCSPLOWO2_12_FULL_39_16 TaxID=1802775 RepID=A0A1G2UR07_9BACT|nr:MAG: hypothetical protein A3D37_01330 [Candidatus Zambryskibacteria bacterium RIFCSPHIGHO2_02_FULL_38_22]OHA97328.1 MAG: hypothetical protein A3E02_00765 [Candidatus Zambryskibacteria bacterium RIFCSPHIGHO2_12_FULL_38_34]OHB08228.1 MAG: hypothetical protein A3I19_01880 [Candidatus Zambryskibacteria bacterium RIFCSPLOWO2_02_FULL_38_13]OHB11770.1 MAG: hypothetical protein A3G46_01500 [Candidatus Zambryskibacteria bacterium RIFCSPLOWO2_12_FULL_39_16]